MRLLIVTQAVDTEDPVLGFFVRWIEEFAKHVEHIEVICLMEGKHSLPANVRVHSLGKEKSAPHFARRLVYAARFKWLAWKLRRDYDAVFVHMNQEYILIAGPLWKLCGKPIYLWRNHYAGSWLTDIAASFCTKVFCTSKHSYTAKYKKAVLMPVGVDTERFHPGHAAPERHSILFLSRMSPSKRPEMLLEALAALAQQGQDFIATFVGSPLPKDEYYYEGLRARASTLGFGERVTFLPGVPNSETPPIYQSHRIFVNTSPSGMFDKTLFEAAASGCTVLASSDDWKEKAGERYFFTDAYSLALRLKEELDAVPEAGAQRAIADSQSLTVLVDRILGTV